MNTELLNEMKAAVANKTAQVLTLEKAKELKGKKIRTIYFGYRGQDGVDEFVVGDFIDDYKDHNGWMVVSITTSDGRNTYIRSHLENSGALTCSDSDRFVYYVVVFEITCKKCGRVHEKVSAEINNPFAKYYDNCRFCMDADDIEALNENYRDHKAEINKINQSYGK